MSDNLNSNAKHLADYTSLFLVAHDANTSAKALDDNLDEKINDKAFQSQWVSMLTRANKPRKLFLSQVK